jgi:DNA-binding Lrp family transcriptional regulator
VEKLTNIDIKILEVLQREGDITNVRLAELVGLSPSPCLQRVRRLRKSGYISDVTAILNLKKIANYVTVYCQIRLSEQTMRQFSVFEAALAKIPEAVECGMTGGEYDYLVKFVVRDMEHFSELSTLMMEMDIGIKNISFNVEVKKVKNAFEMPLRSLLEKKG